MRPLRRLGVRVRARQGAHGYILLPVMLAVAMIAAIAFMMNHEGVNNIRLLDNDLDGARAEYLAQAGLSHARWLAGQQGCGPFNDLIDEPLGGDSYTTTLTSGGGSTTSYTLTVDQDAWIRSDNPTDNKDTDDQLSIRFDGVDHDRPVLRFDLGPIPAGADILSATAWFYVTGAHPEGPVSIHPIEADWTESGATWETIGDAMAPVVLASIPPQPADVWVAVNLTAQVQAWANGYPNHGIMLNSDTDGVQGHYASREKINSPYLEVVVGEPPASPAALKSVGQLANETSRSITRDNLMLYQQPVNTLYLQPDAADGKDTYLYEWKPSWNYGANGEIWADDQFAYSRANGLIRFDLSGIPQGARVVSAVLELYQVDSSLWGGDIGVHRVTSAWIDGDKSGGTGSPNWTQRDATEPWTTAGGDYEASPVAVTKIPIGKAWSSWDIGALVEGWVSGGFENHGMALVAEEPKAAGHFASSDSTDPTLRPKLTVTYTCACGSPCLAPRGEGKVLMVVIDPSGLVPADAYKKALFESWGYTVSVIGESSNQAAYDLEVANADVVFISESVNSNQVDNKLEGVSIGVVSQDGIYNDGLGFASGAAWPVDASVTISDASHYITAPFRTGPSTIYSGGMQQLTIAGIEAAGLQTLAETGGAGSLVVLDEGATTTGGGTAAGRRVMLPLGRDTSLRWEHLNAHGLLLVQRALQWGIGEGKAAPPPKYLLFVAANATPSSLEQARIDLIESWGYTVNLIADEDSQANFDTAVAANDVAYVSSQVVESTLGTKLTDAPIGIVNEQGLLVDEFGFGLQSVNYKSRTELDIVDNSHYITQGFSTGLLTILSSTQDLHIMTANKGAGFVPLGQVFNTGSLWDDSLGVIDTGGMLYGGGSAAGRRALLPWGSAAFDVAALNADGLTIMQRAIEWAEGADAGPTLAYSMLFVVGDPAALTAQESAKKTLMESWGHKVDLIDDADSQAAFDGAIANVDVVYVSEEADATLLGTKLRGATIGVVNEDPNLHSTFGFSSTRYLSSDNSPMTTDGAHYITSPFGGADITLFSSVQPMGSATGTLASGLEVIGTWSSGPMGSLGGLLVLETGAQISGGGAVAGRRVQTPWSGQEGTSVTDIGVLTADGLTVLRRAIEWAAGAGPGGGGGEDTLTLYAVADNRLEAGDTANRGGENNVIVGMDNGSNTEHALVRFDLSGIPAGATITGATLRLSAYRENGSDSWNIEVHRVAEAWTEMGSNWDTSDGTSAWAGGGGGSYDPAVVASLPGDATGWFEWDVTSLVEAWHGGTNPNHGFALVPDAPVKRNDTMFDSRESGAPPELVVTYSAP